MFDITHVGRKLSGKHEENIFQVRTSQRVDSEAV